MKRNSGKEVGFAYSLSRWTDLPAAKWDWFKDRLANGWMWGVDPSHGAPAAWSLAPEDTAGFVFWTRDSRNLVKDAKLLEPYKKVIHFTLTGWHEVEIKAPHIAQGIKYLREAVESFGAENVTWRFSPVPYLEGRHPSYLMERFKCISTQVADMGITEGYVAFLQSNDLMTEKRSAEERAALLEQFGEHVKGSGLRLMLCNEDKTPCNPALPRGICEDGRRFAAMPRTEGCGCALAVDPFTVNETCKFGCKYCYAADSSLAPKKRNTTKPLLPVVR